MTKPIIPYYISEIEDFTLYKGDSIELLSKLDQKVDTIFADPPYFLSNGGISCQSGKMVSVNKGNWDKSHGENFMNNFNKKWIKLCRELLKDDGTIWISGTYHNIFSVANQLTSLGFKILNVITWAKLNPPPNLSCRYFTHSTEFIIWARKYPKTPHYFNYKLMKLSNDNKQMRDVWNLPTIAKWEKTCGKHPTQKPLSLLTRIIASSTKLGETILDPFSGSATTGIAANLLGRKFIGIEKESEFLDISINRRKELNDLILFQKYQTKITSINPEGFIEANEYLRKIKKDFPELENMLL